MNCAFCQAENDPTANFCSDCGSPLGLQICPTCETVCEKAAAACTKCGCALVRTEDAEAGDKFTARLTLRPQPEDDHSLAKETGTDNWHELLQSLEEEVHTQLDLQSRRGAEHAVSAPARRASALSHPLPRRSITQVHEAALIQPAPSPWSSPGLWLVLACAAGGCGLLLSLPSPEIEQRALNSRIGKPAAAPAVGYAAVAPQTETKPILETPAVNPALPSPGPSPADATQSSPAEEQTLAQANISTAAGSIVPQAAPKEDDQNESSRATPVTNARRTSSEAKLSSTASGRSVFANRAAAQRPLSVSHLILTVSPWGEVYVDNKKWGLASPLRVLVLRPGKHSVHIRNANLPPYDETIKLQPDQTLRIKYKFK